MNFSTVPFENDIYFETDPFGTNSVGNMMFTIIPLLIIGLIIFAVVKGIAEWSSNNNSPKLTVPAKVVTKRTRTSNSHHAGDHMHSSSSTSYYVTFQFESGDRSELSLNGRQYGMLAEGDTGMLSFQGTRYLGFERTTSEE